MGQSLDPGRDDRDGKTVADGVGGEVGVATGANAGAATVAEGVGVGVGEAAVGEDAGSGLSVARGVGVARGAAFARGVGVAAGRGGARDGDGDGAGVSVGSVSPGPIGVGVGVGATTIGGRMRLPGAAGVWESCGAAATSASADVASRPVFVLDEFVTARL